MSERLTDDVIEKPASVLDTSSKFVLLDDSGRGFQIVELEQLKKGDSYLLGLHHADDQACICRQCGAGQTEYGKKWLLGELTRVYTSHTNLMNVWELDV